MPTDEELQATVSARLVRDPRVRAHREGGALKVRVQGGVVWLEGWVDHLAEKAISELITRELPEVSQVVNEVRIRAIPERTDAQILAHVRDALEEDPYVDLPKVEVGVEKGVVTLGGSQDALAKKRLAGLIAWWVAGVTNVRNEIVVDPPEADNDHEVVDAVRVAFEKDVLVDALRFQVRARDGVVYLSGVARSRAERQAAEDDAWCVWGVRDVVNDIALEA